MRLASTLHLALFEVLRLLALLLVCMVLVVLALIKCPDGFRSCRLNSELYIHIYTQGAALQARRRAFLFSSIKARRTGH